MNKPDEQTLERLRVRIAELAGWKVHETMMDFVFHGLPSCPDFTGDLNAIHEAVKRLTDYSPEYCMALDYICQPRRDSAIEFGYTGWPIGAEAWQRCIALDRTLSAEPII